MDLESVAEFREPDIKENMEKVKRLGITFGVHSETAATGVEMAELDSAIETDYKFGHDRLKEILERSGELGSKYVLIHASESESFISLERHLQPSLLVDFFGNRLKEFLQKKENEWIIDWALGGKTEDIEKVVHQVWLSKGKKITSQDIEDIFKSNKIEPQNFLWNDIVGRPLSEILRSRMEDRAEALEMETITDYEALPEDKKSAVNEQIRRALGFLLKDIKTSLFDYTQSRHLGYGPERIAYYIIAKYMEKNNDPLWINIIKKNYEYLAKVENKTADQWKISRGIKKDSVEDEQFRLLSYIWVTAVSAKYIWGHLNQDKNPMPNKYSDFKPTLKKYNMPLVLETPMARRGVEQWLRLANPLQMYYLAKDIGSDYVQLAFDLEHMLSVRVDPEIVIDLMPSDGGKFVRVIHAGYPAALAPAHMQIPMGSEQQMYLYKMYYKLWKKGMGKESDCFLVFERGAPESMQQSIIALRKIKEFMEQDIKPENLVNHPDFFGLAVGEIASPERQLSIITEHARDPLRGLIVVPEETYTSLGKAALEKGKRPEEWKKEELR